MRTQDAAIKYIGGIVALTYGGFASIFEFGNARELFLIALGRGDIGALSFGSIAVSSLRVAEALLFLYVGVRLLFHGTRRFTDVWVLLVSTWLVALLSTWAHLHMIRPVWNGMWHVGVVLNVFRTHMTAPVLMGAIMAAIAVFLRKAPSEGNCPCCVKCGYSLRGLHEARCPECGKSYSFEELFHLAYDRSGAAS
jgi:signal transduction histidine kinase